VVTGDYYLQGGVLRIQAQVTDAVRQELLSSLVPVEGSPDSAQALIEDVRQRVMTSLASHYDPRFSGTEGLLSAPPTWEAYTVYLEGLEQMYEGSWVGAARLFLQAAEMDPSFLKAVLMAGFASGTTSVPVEGSDSLLQIADDSREELSAGDQALLDFALAYQAGDPEGALRSMRRAMEVTPVVPGLREYLAGWLAWRLNRPEEALGLLGAVETDQPGVGGFYAYWDFTSRAHHHLGDLKGALAAIDRGEERTGTPSSLLRARARTLAAMGAADELLELLPDLLSTVNEDSRPVHLVPEIVGEFRAHGHGAMDPRVTARVMAWLDTRTPAQKNSRMYRSLLAGAAFSGGQLDEAESLFRELAAEDAEFPAHTAYLGLLAAIRGDREAAERLGDAARSMDPLSGGLIVKRAAISVALGDLPQAMDHLRQVTTARGVPWHVLHSQIDLQPLWDYAPFQEFVEPKG
jgi:tetratricopeptide (TPR) repeat protein